MEISKCMGCMSEYHGYPCPVCGYDPRFEQEIAFTLPRETIIGGKYLVGKVLGQGGFGITYLGWDIALERKVAIKEYYPSGQVSRMPGTRSLIWSQSEQAKSARLDGMQMFLKEARKMAKLDDIPGVVKIRDLFQENDTAYIVMDFVDGTTLKNILKTSGPLSWEQAKPIFHAVIHSMEQVHAAGLIHRDLSPDNLMITPNGGVKILDLGAAKDLNVNSGASSMQVAKGGFSPLEQYTQRGGSGTWTDVYALAATIYFTLTGKLPPSVIDRLDDDCIRWDYPGLLSLPASAREALKQAMIVQTRRRTQTLWELERGLFAQPSQPSQPLPRQQQAPVAPAQAHSRTLEDLINRPSAQYVAEVAAPWQKKQANAPRKNPSSPPTTGSHAPVRPTTGGAKTLAELIDNPNFISNHVGRKESEAALDQPAARSGSRTLDDLIQNPTPQKIAQAHTPLKKSQESFYIAKDEKQSAKQRAVLEERAKGTSKTIAELIDDPNFIHR